MRSFLAYSVMSLLVNRSLRTRILSIYTWSYTDKSNCLLGKLETDEFMFTEVDNSFLPAAEF